MNGYAAVDMDAIRAEFELPGGFPAEAEREAGEAPDRFAGERSDMRELPFVAIDPPGALDIDQLVHVEERDGGFVLRYAIADVGAFVSPGMALHEEAMRRGTTIYLPDGRVPLHPPALSEDRASLLAGQDRPALAWTITFDAAGEMLSRSVERALVRNHAQLDYAGVQGMIDRGERLPEAIAALPAFGRVRQERARQRGAIELRVPEQELVRENGRDQLRLAPRTEVDGWNAQCSLATGMAAASLMIEAGYGILRTLPQPGPRELEAVRAAAAALSIAWPEGLSPGALLDGLDPTDPRTLALMVAARRLLRGSGYLAFTDGAPAPADRLHAGVAGEYAHATAPLRRLADRFAGEACLAIVRGGRPDEAFTEALREVPDRMRAGDRLTGDVENAVLNLAEAMILRGRAGEEFDAVVLRAAEEQRAAEIFIADQAIIAPCDQAAGAPPPAAGSPIRVRLVKADPASRTVGFTPVTAG